MFTKPVQAVGYLYSIYNHNYRYIHIISCCEHLHDLYDAGEVLFPEPQYGEHTTPAEGLGMRPLQKQLVQLHTKLKYAYVLLCHETV